MYELAQFDIVKMRYSSNDQRMEGFFRSAPHVNNLAENHTGFIWREKDDDPALCEELFGAGHLYTISVWENFQSLYDFLYRSPHIAFIKAGHTWFEKIPEPHVVLWWIEKGHKPSLREAYEKLMHLRKNGPSVGAFDLNGVFLPWEFLSYAGGC